MQGCSVKVRTLSLLKIIQADESFTVDDGETLNNSSGINQSYLKSAGNARSASNSGNIQVESDIVIDYERNNQ